MKVLGSGRENEWPAAGVKLDDQHTFGVLRQLLSAVTACAAAGGRGANR